MSVFPPMFAYAGFGIPKTVFNLLPTVSPEKALLSSVFLFNAPHMMTLYLKIKASKGNLDNEDPRKQGEKLKADPTYGGILSRALAAHQNGLESFPVLAAGVVACMATGADKKTAGQLACCHLLSRVAFNIFYVVLPPSPAVGLARTISWAVSLMTSCQLIMFAVTKA
mmetsp:Transcript_67767/g.201604  ORF Transcript_67767/g.201604 Transcript_67767/m.201604 type:complete len:168 (+) Transcript_67767:79-582(+)